MARGRYSYFNQNFKGKKGLTKKLTCYKFILVILSFLEKIVPAILVAQNKKLRNKVGAMEAEISIAKYNLKQNEIKAKTEAENSSKSDHDFIDDFIDTPAGSDSSDQ